MRFSMAWLEAWAVVTALTLVEIVSIILDLRTAQISDWFLSIAPLVWVNSSVLFCYALARKLNLSRGPPLETAKGGWNLLAPRFDLLTVALRSRWSRYLWFLLGTAYFLLYALLQGILFVDLSSSLLPGYNLLGGPAGYGPGLAWSLSESVAIILRPYTASAAVALAILSGLVLTLFTVIIAQGRARVGALPAPLAGLVVMCPACFATPAAGLVAAYVAPAVSLAGLGTAYSFALALTVSTTMLLLSLVLLWLTLSWLSRRLSSA